MSILVGKLVQGKFVCTKCPVKWVEVDRWIPVYDINMESYSQRCSKCREKIVHGSSNLELFPIDRNESEFHWVDMQKLVLQFDDALQKDDLESVGKVRQEMYERILKAIIVDRLHDRSVIFSTLDRIIQTATRWQ